MSTLTIQLPGLPPVSHVLKDDTISIGRMVGNTIVIDDSSVSLFHAKITQKEGVFHLKDLNSTNGTTVNGQPIREAMLHNLDQVQFADIPGQFHGETETIPVVVTPVPTLAPKPALQPAIAPDRVSTELRSQPFDAKAFLSSLVPYMGGIVALCVVSVLVWKLMHADKDVLERSADAGPSSLGLVPGHAEQKPPPPQSKEKDATAKPLAVGSNTPDPLMVGQVSAQSVPELVKSLQATDPAERRRAATALHSMGAESKAANPALREALKDSDPEVRMWCALTLINNECYDKTAIPILITALRHENPVIRQVACLSLGLIPYDDAEKENVVPVLSETASVDRDAEVRKAALSALTIIDPDAGAKLGLK